MAGPQGLTGLSPVLGSITLQPEATPEQRLGDPADVRHGQELVAPLAATGYPWEVLAGVVAPKGPFGAEAQLIGQAQGWPDPHGTGNQDPTFDRTPRTHAAPWPKGVEQSTDPDATARQLIQSRDIHASDTGASGKIRTTIAALQDRWAEIWTVTPGTSIQEAGGDQQKSAAGGYGTTDRVTSFARQNAYGFDAAHAHRRYSTGSIPGNYLWMKPGGRPMVKSQPGPARPPVGEVSPFTGQDLAQSYGVQGAVLQDDATEYQAPPEPYLAPDYGPGGDPAPVSWW
ncbi:hypothetical protein GCM10009527_098280 [Actinomadura nitritigenes]|uniref:Uncharacterized protein n=1 Tax=Actinomadura nitritigenes TaxID=134602 RepID=A0ABS3QWB9_9ACTN|nr:hypothetical protein [Actinomadura nitritigenes]MBO2438273.1 hypothetical protein [Actinomadura nitritigenes]